MASQPSLCGFCYRSAFALAKVSDVEGKDRSIAFDRVDGRFCPYSSGTVSRIRR
jgi:hypothetical protein